MSTAILPEERTIKPDGLPLAILVISSVFLVLSLIAVALRTYTRLAKKNLGLDDVFIIVGTIVYTVSTNLSIYGTLIGLGRLTPDLNAWQASEAIKYYIIWILLYVLALATVKSSICITIMRIAQTNTNLRIAILALLTVTWASFFITFIGTFLYCRPVSAIWTPQLVIEGKGICAPVSTLVIIGHVATVSTILTDMGLVLVPAIMLWNTQMKKQQKLQAFGLLSFASVASVITMVRIPYINKFEKGEDLPFWVAHTILCSNVETGIGCIASSVPSLRHFFRRTCFHNDSSTGPSNKRSAADPSKNFFTIGSQPRNKVSAEIGLATMPQGQEDWDQLQGREDWERLHDGASDKSDVPIEPRGAKGYGHSVGSQGKSVGTGVEVNDIESQAQSR